jgi:hypothetical protein
MTHEHSDLFHACPIHGAMTVDYCRRNGCRRCDYCGVKLDAEQEGT